MARWTEDLTLDLAPAEILLLYISRFAALIGGCDLLFLEHDGLEVPNNIHLLCCRISPESARGVR